MSARAKRPLLLWSGLALLALLLVAGAWSTMQTAQAQFQEINRSRFIQWTYQDAGALARQVAYHAPLYGASAALLLPAARLDPPLLEAVQVQYDGFLGMYLDHTNALGGSRAMPVAAGLWAVSLTTDSERFQDAAFTSLEALLYAGMLTRALKGIVGRARPEAGVGAYEVAPLSGRTSFPSGHTTAAFALITPWVLYYPSMATYSLFALSAGTAVARIAQDKHWPTDVVAGAATGFLTARFLTRRHRKPTAPDAWIDVHPLLGYSAVGLRLQIHFR